MTCKLIFMSGGRTESKDTRNGARLTPVPVDAGRSGYVELAAVIVTPVVELVSEALIPVAASNPVLFKTTARLPLSPGSISPSPSQHISVGVKETISRKALPVT